MNCSVSPLPPGSVRSVNGTEQATLVSSMRKACAACNVTTIYAGRPFRATVIDLCRSSNQVWGLAKTDEHWEAAVMASRRDDLRHGTNAACVKGLQRLSGAPTHPEEPTRAGRARIIVRAAAVVAATEPEIMESGSSLI